MMYKVTLKQFFLILITSFYLPITSAVSCQLSFHHYSALIYLSRVSWHIESEPHIYRPAPRLEYGKWWYGPVPFYGFQTWWQTFVRRRAQQSRGFWLQVTCKGREKAGCNHSRSILTQRMHIGQKSSINRAKEKRWSRVAAASCSNPLNTNTNLTYI
jgi:hypothetical protein